MKNDDINRKDYDKATLDQLGKVYLYEERNDDPLFFSLNSFKNWGYPLHFHSAAELYYICSGKMSALINGQKMILSEGDITFANPNEVHQYEIDGECHVMTWSAGTRFLNEFNSVYKGDVFENLLADKEYNKRIYNVLADLQGDLSGMSIMRKIAFTNEILALLSDHYKPVNKKPGAEFVAKVIEYIHANYNLDIKRIDIAKEFGYAENSFSRLFNRLVGVDFRIFLSAIRAQKADEMLREERNRHLNIAYIASACGFDSMATFYRSYKRCFGRLPIRA